LLLGYLAEFPEIEKFSIDELVLFILKVSFIEEKTPLSKRNAVATY
jgi:hypothetical protein